MRDAPSLDIIETLHFLGAKIRAFDPAAESKAKELLPEVIFCPDPYETAKGAEVLVIMTEWPEFREIDLKKLKKLMASPKVVDGRNIFDPAKMRKLGFKYISIGRV